jgi:alcohol dehydrogenase (cytochrome c)
VIGAVLFAIGGVTIGGWLLRGGHWRLRVIALKVGGRLEDLSWVEMLRWLRPRSPVYLGDLANSGNPYVDVHTPFLEPKEDRKAVERGRKNFHAACAQCHGEGGTGGTAPSLVNRQFVHGASDWALFRTITRGVPGTAMRSRSFPELETWQLVAYLRSLARDQAGTAAPAVRISSVTAERLRHAAAEPWNWLTYSGTLDGQRHSALDQVNTTNVQRLQLAWVYQSTTNDLLFETSPLVIDGTMFLTESPSNVVALDAATGRRLWRLERRIPDDVSACCGRVNRGLAVFGGLLYLATLDAHLVAIDASTGRQVWDVVIADYREGYSSTAAPLVVDNLVVTGVAGGEFGIRGFLTAFDSASGARRWRFWTVPAPGEPGSETWTGESWKTGGAPTWLTGSYDPELKLVYWGVGNPSPNYQGARRAGDNLFTNSVIALARDTGALAWHFQFTPHDDHDWDSNQIPMLADVPTDGGVSRLLLWANRNGFYYVLDRVSGKFLRAAAFAKQTWADRIGEDGRPVKRPTASPSETGSLVYPGVSGATNWWSPSYEPRSRRVYVPVREQGSIFFKRGDVPFRRGELFTGSSSQPSPEDHGYVAVRALDAVTGELVWEHRFPPDSYRSINGLLSTAGGLVFVGEGSKVVALEQATGAVLWTMETGARVWAAPIAYSADGRQMLAVASGRSLFAFALPQSQPPREAQPSRRP